MIPVVHITNNQNDLVAHTAGAVSIATISEKTAGTKFEISTLRNMIETSGFFHCTHICSSNIR